MQKSSKYLVALVASNAEFSIENLFSITDISYRIGAHTYLTFDRLYKIHDLKCFASPVVEIRNYTTSKTNNPESAGGESDQNVSPSEASEKDVSQSEGSPETGLQKHGNYTNSGITVGAESSGGGLRRKNFGEEIFPSARSNSATFLFLKS